MGMGIGEAALLAASLASTAAGTYMNNQAQKSSVKNYNNQVTQQNRLLEQQFAEKRQKTDAARQEQARVFQDVAAAQDAEFENQKALADKKAKVFQEAVQQPQMMGGNPAEMEASVARRNKLFADTSGPLPGSYETPGDNSTENRVLRQSAEAASAKEDARTGGIASALARISAAGDIDQKRNALFRDLDMSLGDVANEAVASSRLLNYKLRPSEYRMNALGNVIGEQVNTPYFRGQEPFYRQPNTTAGDILSGAGQIGSGLVFRGAFTPNTGAQLQSSGSIFKSLGK